MHFPSVSGVDMKRMNLIKLGISVIWDIFDLTFGRIPVVGTLIDMIGGFLAMVLWGKLGVFAFGELIDVTDQLDTYVPSLTIIGMISVLKG